MSVNLAAVVNLLAVEYRHGSGEILSAILDLFRIPPGNARARLIEDWQAIAGSAYPRRGEFSDNPEGKYHNARRKQKEISEYAQGLRDHWRS